ncbi:MAG: hypothetical protein KAJ12_15010, partial [Bacteroidetes bacterium]|nr:hypothetical protein [Bacteroidota bacterium]
MSVPLVLLATTGYGQDFEKEGRSVELDEVTAAPGTTGSGGPHPFDVLGYVLDVRLAMADEHLGGHMLITMLLRSDVDSIELNEALLTLDTVKVDGIVRDFTVDPSSETFTIDLGGTRNEGDTLRIQIDYRRDPALTRPSKRQGYYFFDQSVGIPANLGYT